MTKSLFISLPVADYLRESTTSDAPFSLNRFPLATPADERSSNMRAGVSGPLFANSISSLFFSATLVALWKFDEGSGTTAADSSGNGNTGTLTKQLGIWLDSFERK